MTAKGRWWALAAVSLATLMTYLDNNVINVAIPTIQRDLHLSVTGLEWIVSSYLLVLAGLLTLALIAAVGAVAKGASGPIGHYPNASLTP